MNVGLFLRKARLERNLSLRDVSKAVGISYSSLCEYEKGLTDPPASKFFKLCDFYNVYLGAFNGEDVESVVYRDFTLKSKKKIKAIVKFEMDLKFDK